MGISACRSATHSDLRCTGVISDSAVGSACSPSARHALPTAQRYSGTHVNWWHRPLPQVTGRVAAWQLYQLCGTIEAVTGEGDPSDVPLFGVIEAFRGMREAIDTDRLEMTPTQRDLLSGIIAAFELSTIRASWGDSAPSG